MSADAAKGTGNERIDELFDGLALGVVRGMLVPGWGSSVPAFTPLSGRGDFESILEQEAKRGVLALMLDAPGTFSNSGSMPLDPARDLMGIFTQGLRKRVWSLEKPGSGAFPEFEAKAAELVRAALALGFNPFDFERLCKEAWNSKANQKAQEWLATVDGATMEMTLENGSPSVGAKQGPRPGI